MAGTLGIATLETAVDTQGLDKGLNQSKSKTASFFDDVEKGFKQKLGMSAADAAVEAVVAIKDFAVDSVKQFQTFEAAANEVFTLIPQASASAREKMKADILDFSTEVGRTTDEVIPALYQSISAGVPAENVFDFLTIANQAALGGVTDLETAVDGITSVVNAYGAEVVDAAQASDLMFTAVKGGKTDFESLSNSLFNVIPTAASLGVEFGNVTAALAAMTAQGTPTSVATTQLRQLFIELSKDGSKVADTFERVAGQSFKEFVAGGGNVQQALQLLEQHAASSDVSIGDLFSSVEAGAAALTLTGQGTAKFTAELAAAEDAAGATAAAAETMQESGVQASRELTAAFEALKITVGEELAPAVGDLTEVLTEGIIQVNAIIGPVSDMNTVLKATGGSFVGLATGMAQSLVDGKGLTGAFTELLKQEEDTYKATKDLETAIVDVTAVTTEAVIEATALTEITAEQREAMISAGEAAQGEFAALEGLTAQQITHVVQRNIATQAAESNAAAIEAAAEAERVEAEALAALQERLGGYFDAALTAEGQTKSLEMTMYDMGAQAGLGATDLAILAAATGEFSQAEIEAAFQAALMQENIASMVQAVKEGTITADEAVVALRNLQSGEADTAAEAMNLAQNAAAAAGALDGVSGSAIDAANQLNNIPTSIDIHIGFDVDALPPLPGDGNYNPNSGSGPFATGGWTGNGQDDELAGFVHRNELVVPADVLRSGMDQIMAFAQKHVPSGILPSSQNGRMPGNSSSNNSRSVALYGDVILPGVTDTQTFLEQMEAMAG